MVHRISRALTMTMLVLAATSPLRSQELSYNFSIDEAGSEALLSVSTVDDFPCTGYTIRTAVHWEEDTAVVVFLGLIPPTPCISGFDVATGEALLNRNGKSTFLLRFEEGKHTDLWFVTMTINGTVAKPVHTSFSSYAP